MSSFPFIDDSILQANLDITFELIIELLTLSESESYKEKETLVSSLRKTIIIHTASIIEALLLWKLKQVVSTQKIEMSEDWIYCDVKLIYPISTSEEIVGCRRKKEKKDLTKLDFFRITDYCCKLGIVGSNDMKERINKVRELRNKLHIGSLPTKESVYTKNDLEFCFNILAEVKKIVST